MICKYLHYNNGPKQIISKIDLCPYGLYGFGLCFGARGGYNPTHDGTVVCISSLLTFTQFVVIVRTKSLLKN